MYGTFNRVYRVPVPQGLEYLTNFNSLCPMISFHMLDCLKIKFVKSSSMNWIFNLQKFILKLIFACYTGSQTWFFQLDFFKNQVQVDKAIGSLVNKKTLQQRFTGGLLSQWLFGWKLLYLPNYVSSDLTE